MSDLIERQDAIDDLHGKDPSRIWDTADIEVWINELPSAEPERVVCAEVKLSKEEIQEAVDDAVKKMMAEMAEPERKCDSCRYRNLEWDEEPCDSCTGGGESCHYKPEPEPSNCSEFPNNWIPCSEKPDSRGVYRVTVQCEHVDGYPDYEVCYGEYDEENGWFLLDEPVGRINMVAWMRIDYVEPYQPEEESE